MSLIKIVNSECYQYWKDSLLDIDGLATIKPTEKRINDIKLALLEYRRENNIFEVGDFVLPISSKFSDEVLELTEDYLGLDFKYKSRSGSFGFILKSFMPTKWRHATTEEIQAGRRL